MENWLKNVIRYGVCFVVFLTPLLYFGGEFFTPYVTSKTFVFYGMVELIFAVWLYLILIHQEYRLPRLILLLYLPLLTLITWLTLTGISGINPEMSFWSSLGRGTGLITIYHCLALSVIIVSLIKSLGTNFVRQLLLWFIGGALVVTLSVWFGNEGINLPFEFLQRSKGGGLIGNSSLTATYLVFAFFLGLFLLFSDWISKRQKYLIGSVLLLIIFSPLFFNLYGLFALNKLVISARGALLGIIIGLGVSGVVWLSLSNHRVLRYLGLASLVITVLFFGWSWNQLLTPGSVIHNKFIAGATASRFIFWDIAQQGIAEKPLLGWGLENYNMVYQKYFNPEILKQSSTSAEIWVDRAHNVFYEIGVAGGYPAILLYSVFLLSILFGLYKSFMSKKVTRIQAGILCGLVAGYVIQNLFVFDSLSSYLGLLILGSLAFGLCSDSVTIGDSKKRSDWYKFNLLFSVLLSLVLLVSLFFLIFLPLRKVVKISEIFTLPLNKRFEQYNNLLHISPVGDAWEIGKLAEDTYGLYSNNLKKIKEDPLTFSYSKKDLKSFLEYLNVIFIKEPYNYRLCLNIMRLSNIYVKLYDKDNQELINKISELSRKARGLSPNHFNIIYSIKH